MRIVHVITRLIVGGAQENTLLSCEGQHALGHDVTLVTGPAEGPEGSLLQRAQSTGYRVEILPEMKRAILPGKDLKTFLALKRLYRQLNPDIIHTHSSKAGILGRWAAADVRRRGCGVVHTIHGLAFTASTRPAVNTVYKYLERSAAHYSDRIVCVADAMAQQSLAENIGTPAQYVTVYSGMETGAFINPPVPRETTRQRLGLSPDHIAVGTIARLFHLKGHEDLIALAPDLCRKFPTLRFLWVGDGILRGQFEQRIAAAGLQKHFIFTGLVPPSEVPNLTAAMDILVHPSRREGLARAIPQGQLARCPVLTYDIDGNREGLLEGITGYALKPFDVAALGRHLETLLASPAQRIQMGAAGRAFALSRFDTKVMVDGLEQVYASIKRK